MSMSVEQSDHVSKLRARLAAAQQRRSDLKKEIKKLERKEDDVAGVISQIEYELDEIEVRSWGGNPKWQILLRSDNSGFMYRALEHCLKEIGLHMGFGVWADNKERIVAIALDSGDGGAVVQNAAAIRTVFPYMKSHKGGWVWINILHHSMSESSWTLRIAIKTGKVALVQEIHSFEEQSIPFLSIESALEYVQANLWNEDYIDQAGAGMLTIEAN